MARHLCFCHSQTIILPQVELRIGLDTKGWSNDALAFVSTAGWKSIFSDIHRLANGLGRKWQGVLGVWLVLVVRPSACVDHMASLLLAYMRSRREYREIESSRGGSAWEGTES